MTVLIDSVMLMLILSNLLLLAFSQLRSCVRTVAFQGILLGLLPLLARQDDLALEALLLSTVTIGVKGIIFPRLLLGVLRDAGVRHEEDPYVGYVASTLAGFVALGLAAWFCSRFFTLHNAVSTLASPVSFFMIFVGLFITVSRKKALSQILGYLVLENGMYVFGVVMLREMPLLVDLGVLLDVFVAVFVMGLAVYHIHREFAHMDVDQLDMLKG